MSESRITWHSWKVSNKIKLVGQKLIAQLLVADAYQMLNLVNQNKH